jgi:hypothetical protein
LLGEHSSLFEHALHGGRSGFFGENIRCLRARQTEESFMKPKFHLPLQQARNDCQDAITLVCQRCSGNDLLPNHGKVTPI